MTSNKKEISAEQEQLKLLEEQRNRGTTRASALNVLTDGTIGDPNNLVNGASANNIGEQLEFEVVESDNGFPSVKAVAENGDTYYITPTQAQVRVVPASVIEAEKEAIAQKNKGQPKQTKSKKAKAAKSKRSSKPSKSATVKPTEENNTAAVVTSEISNEEGF